MTHLFIINPAAGSRDRTEKYRENIQRICGERGIPYRIEVSSAPGECTRIAREAAQTGEAVRIYACGGDGTLNEVAAGAAGYPNAAVTVFSGGRKPQPDRGIHRKNQGRLRSPGSYLPDSDFPASRRLPPSGPGRCRNRRRVPDLCLRR